MPSVFPVELKTFEAAITSPEFSSDDYCGMAYAARLLAVDETEVQDLLAKGEIEAWKTLAGHARLHLASVAALAEKQGGGRRLPDPDDLSPLRVMLVEDDEVTLELYRCQFEDWDLPVDCSWMSSALDAMMDIASLRPNLLITDLSMPGLDGLEMLHGLKRNQHLAEMQTIVISGFPAEAIAARGGLPPNARLVQKPVDFSWLEGFVTALASLRKRRAGPATGPR
ncbi:MAG: response regulator [Pseudomonadota bacterium]